MVERAHEFIEDERRPLRDVTVVEVGDSIGVSVAGFLLRELGATVTKVSTHGDLGSDSSRIFNRAKTFVGFDGFSEFSPDLLLVDEGTPDSFVENFANEVRAVIRFRDEPGDLEVLAPSETMLAEAASGIMWLQLGHRDGPFCLASPIAGLGAGILGALGAVSGLLRHARGVNGTWRSDVDYAKGALLFQSLSAAFMIDSSPQRKLPPRYRDPYCVSYSPLMRFHQVRDGWVFVAAVSSHMWKTLFGLMNRPDLLEDEELQAALPYNIANQRQGDDLARSVGNYLKNYDVDDIVQLLVDHKIVAAPVLSSAAFLRHPQASANGLPVDVVDAHGLQTQVGNFLAFSMATADDADKLPALDASDVAPLEGIRVLDVSRAAAGPICGRVLADLGAEVVRVEDPEGESSRMVGLTFVANNRGKLSMGLDLTNDVGRDVLRRFTRVTNVVLTNALPAASVRLGIDWPTVADVNKNACHVSLLGFGRFAPFGGRRVVDAAAQALSGQALAEGGGQEPVGCSGGFLDNGAGWLAALGTVAVLYQQQVTGRSGSVEASLLNTSAFIQLHRLCSPELLPAPTLDADRLGYAADQRLYELSDKWICVAATSEEQRSAFSRAAQRLGFETVGDDATASQRADGPIACSLETAFKVLTLEEVARLFSDAGFDQWTQCFTLEERARSDSYHFQPVPQQPWGAVLEPRRMPEFVGQREITLRGAAEDPGLDDVTALGWLDAGDDEREALIVAGALRREPKPATLIASTV
ncbi:MAG TPA: CoA transferase [Acidimicrobiales bacterium]|nr:CoA transferase [Acidimicrobiales bacterium]